MIFFFIQIITVCNWWKDVNVISYLIQENCIFLFILSEQKTKTYMLPYIGYPPDPTITHINLLQSRRYLGHNSVQ